jgi:hypothetical protein
MSSVDKNAGKEVLSDRLIELLRERVRDNARQELLNYIDELVPEYQLLSMEAAHVDDTTEYHIQEFLQYYDEDFIRFLYPAILKREPDPIGLHMGLEALRAQELSRIHLLGRLRYSAEGEKHGIIIRGLKLRYLLVRLQKVPALGRFLSTFTNLKLLDELGSRTVNTQTELLENQNKLDATASAISAHFTTVEKNLGRSPQDELNHLTGVFSTGDKPVALIDLLRLSEADFVSLSYSVICGREPTDIELAKSLQDLFDGAKSKIRLLGELCDSSGINQADAGIIGLAGAYRLEKIESLPVLGFLFRLPRLLFILSRLDAILDYQGSRVANGARQIARVESRLIGHYNSTVRQIKREVLEAMKSDSDTNPNG